MYVICDSVSGPPPGSDARKLRDHLNLCKQLGAEKTDKLLEEREDVSPDDITDVSQ